MRILIVSSYLPFPLFSGGHIRLYNLLKELSKKHEITLVCEKRPSQTKNDIEEIGKICKKVITVARKKQWTYGNILKTGISLRPFLLIGHNNYEMKEHVSRLLKREKFDLIHVETFYVYQNVPKTNLPVVLTEHNIEYLVYKRFADQAPIYFKPLLYADVAKLKYWEKWYWEKATKLVAVSEADKKVMKRDDVVVVPNGVDTNKFKVFASRQSRPASQQGGRKARRSGQSSKFKVEQNEKRVLFIGDFKWVQNTDAVKWILKEMWPSFAKAASFAEVATKAESAGKPKINLWIVGKNIPRSIRKLTTDDNVIFDENAPEETEKIFQKADVLLAPIRVGSGSQYKILEAMASGVLVVTTRLGIDGLEAEPNKHVLISENASEFVDQVTRVLQDEKLYKEIVQNARKLIEEKYDWKIITKKLEEVYSSVL